MMNIDTITNYLAARRLRKVQAEIALLREQLAYGHQRLGYLTDLERRLAHKARAQSIMSLRVVP